MAKTATIKGHRVELQPEETVLQAALRSGIDFPHSCRVGGCATCKCRQTEGEVHERTEPAYLLSGVAPGASWSGARGLVTQHLPALLEPGAQAYLCGPPPMVDAACAVLKERGVPRERTHADRFRTRAEAPAQADAALPPTQVEASGPVMGVLHYLKFFLFHLVGLFAAATLLAGGRFITVGFLAVLGFYVVGDAVGGDDTSTPTFRHPGVLTAQLWRALPLGAGAR